MLFGSLLSSPSAAELWLILTPHPQTPPPLPPPPPLRALLSHLPLSRSLSLSRSKHLSPLLSLAKPDIATATCKLTDAHAHGTHARETCYLATQGWDRCRPISVASERAVNEERGPIDGRVLLHNNLKRGGFNHFLTFRITVWPSGDASLQPLAHADTLLVTSLGPQSNLSIYMVNTQVWQK